MNEQQDLVPQNEDEVDSLLESISEPANEALVEPGAKAPQTQAEAAQQQAIQEYAFKVGGKEVKAPIEKILRWAEQGYDAPNRIGELNKKLEGYSTKEQQFKEWQDKYGPVDEYVRQNPQWFQYVQGQYQQQMQGAQGANNPIMSVVEQLKQEVEGLKGVASTYQQQEAARVAQREDSAYMQEFTTIQKQYPKIDFSTPGPDGKSLEYKVLEYAQQNGIKKFTTAFRDVHHDELLKLKEEEAKEKVINDRQSKSKLGILGISATPTRKTSDSVKGKSYQDLEREALTELGIG